jgi:hypothetical protein
MGGSREKGGKGGGQGITVREKEKKRGLSQKRKKHIDV